MEKMKSEHPITEMADALEVSASGYADHLHKDQLPRRMEDRRLQAELVPIFEQSRSTYGSPRLHDALHKKGYRCGKNRVARLQKSLGLRPKQKRRWRRTTKSNPRLPVAPNWLAKVPAPDKAWQKSKPPRGLLHHCDRGGQYASERYQDLLRQSGATASMSAAGNCYDNAAMESFWATLKAKCFAHFVPETNHQATLMIFDYIEGFYNRTRTHSSLGYKSPLEFESSINHNIN